LPIPRHHHEKWDGSGYPDGLAREAIPLAARLFAFADVYDALTSDRPYRPAWSQVEALEYVTKNSGIHFDPKIAPVFIRMMTE
jgi:HD-GYP domain-containing protein (c-di-GMP phosphodiesterase class II)